MLILGIETSCDETAAALVDGEGNILSQALHSQIDDHQIYGGVVPEIASREHLRLLAPMVQRCLQQAGKSLDAVDAIAVTAGPGLIGGVMVGVMLAKGLAAAAGKPLIAVNHLEAHALTVRMVEKVEFPYLLLLVSGGHCQFLVVEGVGRYQLLGQTIDDALGEAFDKVAKMLGLPYPGGPEVEQLARTGDAARFTFPMPLCREPGCDFSFSGLKTAVLRQWQLLKQQGTVTEQDKADICASFQRTVAAILTNRLTYAVETFQTGWLEGKVLVLAGGVAANQFLRGALESVLKTHHMQLIAPPLKLCTDNAAMVAWAGIERFQLGMQDDLFITPQARLPLA